MKRDTMTTIIKIGRHRNAQYQFYSHI